MYRGIGHLGPRGPEDGPPALVIPGFLASDRTTMELRRYLAAAGWRVHPWAMGVNRGAHGGLIEDLDARLNRIGGGQKVLVVGWSLGGVFARELARARPDKVRAVVTMGSPFSGHRRLNNMWRVYEKMAGHSVDEPPIPQSPDKPPVPTLTFWSRRDGIVAPRAARGLPQESDHIVEVSCTHMGFGMSRRVLTDVVREIDSFVKNAR